MTHRHYLLLALSLLVLGAERTDNLIAGGATGNKGINLIVRGDDDSRYRRTRADVR